MTEIRKKPSGPSYYNHPVKQVFSKSTKRFKKANTTLADSSIDIESLPKYSKPNGLNRIEVLTSLAELERSINWDNSSIYPKSDFTKKEEFLALAEDCQIRNQKFGF